MMTQYEDRIQQRHDRATAKRARDSQGDWVKHTINLRKKTRLNEIMESCGNKSHFVREMFKQMNGFKAKAEALAKSEKKLMANIAKLQVVITESFTQEQKIDLVDQLIDEEEEIDEIAPPTKSAMEQWADIQKGIYE